LHSTEHGDGNYTLFTHSKSAICAYAAWHMQVMTLGPQVAAHGRVHDGNNIDSTLQMLTALTPEARTMVLATMPPVQRWKVRAFAA
jgi:hypothetical protein